MRSSKRTANAGPHDNRTAAGVAADAPAPHFDPGSSVTEQSATRLPRFVLTHAGELLGEDTAENRETVRRIHACVSACDGISTDELERGIVADMRRVIAEVVPVLETRVRG
jgi:hypothetical protein